MALENRIDSLKQKHARLDQMLHEEEAHHGADDLLLHRLKLEKLRLKDEIEVLRHGHCAAA